QPGEMGGEPRERKRSRVRPPRHRLVRQPIQQGSSQVQVAIDPPGQLRARVHGQRGEKSTVGTVWADSGASKYGYSSNPNMRAVMFDGNRRRSELYSWRRSL